MARETKLKSTDDLRDLLQYANPADDLYVACRSVSRVLPLLSRARGLGGTKARKITLLALLAVLVGTTSRRFPSADVFDAADAVHTELSELTEDLTISDVEPTALAAIDAALAISFATADGGAQTGYILDAIDAACTAAYNEANANAEILASTEEDLLRVAKRSSGDFLLREPLWVFRGERDYENGRNAPKWFLDQLSPFITRLNQFGPQWRFWADWYVAVMEGRDPEVFRDEEQLNEFLDWLPEQYGLEADEIMESLANLLGRLYLVWTGYSGRLGARDATDILSLSQDSSGATFAIHGSQLQLQASATEDAAAAKHPVTQQLHSSAIVLLQSFRETAYAINNIIDWRGFGRSYDALIDCMDCETQTLGENVATFWCALCDVGTWLERDDDIRLGVADGTQLDSSARRQLDAILKITSPLLRRFPTGLELDDEMSTFTTPGDRYGAAVDLVHQSAAVQLISARDREVLENFIAAVERGEFQGKKLAGYVSKTGKNLAIQACSVVAALYLGAVGGVVGEDSLLATRAGEALLSAEAAVVELFSDSPTDIRMAIRGLLEDLKQIPPPPLPGENRDLLRGIVGSRRTGDDEEEASDK